MSQLQASLRGYQIDPVFLYSKGTTDGYTAARPLREDRRTRRLHLVACRASQGRRTRATNVSVAWLAGPWTSEHRWHSLVMAGNPTLPSGAFFDAFTKERGIWNCFTIDAFASPNLKGLGLDQLLRLDPAEGGPLDQNPFPFLATRRWIYDQYQIWWHGSESSSPNWLSRVLARFPDQAENALIKMIWLEQAKQHALQEPVRNTGSGPLVAGVDVGGGGEAETVAYVCQCKRDGSKIVAMGAWRGEDTRGQVVNFLDHFRARLSIVRVDAIGVGHNFALHLSDCRFPVDPINVGRPCPSKPHLRENDPARRFVNLRALYYQTVADAFERGQVEGLTDETTIGQLAGLLYEIDAQGRMKIESKEKARQRGVPSPDRADALALALGQIPALVEFFTPSHPPGGHSHLDQRFLDQDANDLCMPRKTPEPGRLVKSRRWGPGAW